MCRHELIPTRVYGHYWDLHGVKKRIFLGYDLESAIAKGSEVKEGLWFQMNPHQILLMVGLLE